MFYIFETIHRNSLPLRSNLDICVNNSRNHPPSRTMCPSLARNVFNTFRKWTICIRPVAPVSMNWGQCTKPWTLLLSGWKRTVRLFFLPSRIPLSALAWEPIDRCRYNLCIVNCQRVEELDESDIRLRN